MAHSVHLVLLGAHTRVVASLCAMCPSGPSGCCAAPPGLSWADIGRIAALSGAGWVLNEMRAGRLTPGPRGLIIERKEWDWESPPEGIKNPQKKCVYHGAEGCEVPADRRSAACNYYVCNDALTEAGGHVGAEAACAAWMSEYATWDAILSSEVIGWSGVSGNKNGIASESDEEVMALFIRLGKRFMELSGSG